MNECVSASNTHVHHKPKPVDHKHNQTSAAADQQPSGIEAFEETCRCPVVLR